MSLSKPILNVVPAWDVVTGYTFTFNVVGGDQVTGSTLTIRNNSTNVVVYTHTETSYKYINTVPANVAGLVNGTYYNAYLTTTNVNGDISVQSNIIQFYCYSTPVLTFTNIVAGGSINSSQLDATAQYTQVQNELLNSYSIILYNSARTQIATSGEKYVSSSDLPPTTIHYLFGGLQDNTSYYAEAKGTTINGTTITTGLIQFTVDYISPSVYSRLFVENNCSGGYITINSNVVIIDGTSNPSPPIYIDNSKIDLTATDSWAKWSQDYVISNDFTSKLWFYKPNINSTLLTLMNDSGLIITVNYRQDIEDSTKAYTDLTSDGLYYIYTPSITKPTDTRQVCIQIRRINNIYELKMEAI